MSMSTTMSMSVSMFTCIYACLRACVPACKIGFKGLEALSCCHSPDELLKVSETSKGISL